MKITVRYIHPDSEKKEAENHGKTSWLPLANHPGFEYFDILPSQGVWSKIPLRLRYVRAKPSLNAEEFRQINRLAGHWLAEIRKAEGTGQAPYQDCPPDLKQEYENFAEFYGYRSALFPRLTNRKKHPILSRIFRRFPSLQYSSASSLRHLEIIITRTSAKKKGGAS